MPFFGEVRDKFHEVDISQEKRDFQRHPRLLGIFHDGEDPRRVPFQRACEIVREAGERLGMLYGRIYDYREIDGKSLNSLCKFNPTFALSFLFREDLYYRAGNNHPRIQNIRKYCGSSTDLVGNFC